MPTFRIVVRGHVQGVGFRFFVHRRAEVFGLRGEVWNRRDGGVEIVAGHDREEVLKAFVSGLNEGPGRVSDMTTSVDGEVPLADSFSVGPTR